VCVLSFLSVGSLELMPSLKLQPACQPIQSDTPDSIFRYFVQLGASLSDKTLFIDVDLNAYQICLCFMSKPKGRDFKPIKDLTSRREVPRSNRFD
jgi:hypothetical protein